MSTGEPSALRSRVRGQAVRVERRVALLLPPLAREGLPEVAER